MTALLPALYLLGSFLIGVMGMNRKFGFWGYFFCSLLLTPFVGAVVVLASDPRKPRGAA